MINLPRLNGLNDWQENDMLNTPVVNPACSMYPVSDIRSVGIMVIGSNDTVAQVVNIRLWDGHIVWADNVQVGGRLGPAAVVVGGRVLILGGETDVVEEMEVNDGGEVVISSLETRLKKKRAFPSVVAVPMSFCEKRK